MSRLIDAIDRNALKNEIVKRLGISDRKYLLPAEKAIWDVINDAPTIDPERKTGEWIDKGWNGDWQYQMDGRGNSWHEWQCSECSHITKGAKWNFCPSCGAKMEEGE